MSFRQFGGKRFAAKNNIVSNLYNTSNTLFVTQKVGQPNSYINFESDISGNIVIYGNLIVTQDETIFGLLNVEGGINAEGAIVTTYGITTNTVNQFNNVASNFQVFPTTSQTTFTDISSNNLISKSYADQTYITKESTTSTDISSDKLISKSYADKTYITTQSTTSTDILSDKLISKSYAEEIYVSKKSITSFSLISGGSETVPQVLSGYNRFAKPVTLGEIRSSRKQNFDIYVPDSGGTLRSMVSLYQSAPSINAYDTANNGNYVGVTMNNSKGITMNNFKGITVENTNSDNACFQIGTGPNNYSILSIYPAPSKDSYAIFNSEIAQGFQFELNINGLMTPTTLFTIGMSSSGAPSVTLGENEISDDGNGSMLIQTKNDIVLNGTSFKETVSTLETTKAELLEAKETIRTLQEKVDFLYQYFFRA